VKTAPHTAPHLHRASGRAHLHWAVHPLLTSPPRHGSQRSDVNEQLRAESQGQGRSQRVQEGHTAPCMRTEARSQQWAQISAAQPLLTAACSSPQIWTDRRAAAGGAPARSGRASCGTACGPGAGELSGRAPRGWMGAGGSCTGALASPRAVLIDHLLTTQAALLPQGQGVDERLLSLR